MEIDAIDKNSVVVANVKVLENVIVVDIGWKGKASDKRLKSLLVRSKRSSDFLICSILFVDMQVIY